MFFPPWVLRQAWELIVVPLAGGVRQVLIGEASEKIAAPISERLFGEHVPGPNGGLPTATKANAGLTADMDFVKTLEEAPEAGAVLGEEMERILGVKLGADEVQGDPAAGVKRGTNGWYVSAYSAILWRIAMLAVWEERPIAIQGALQGREWVTVCVPRVGRIIDPSTMWRQPDPGTLLRVLQDREPADFFVRQIKGKSVRGRVITELNEQFMIDPKAAFKPAEAESVADGWHRIDGVSRKWVLLKPDADARKTIVSHRPQATDISGKPIFRPNLEIHPPKFKEYPAEWQPLLKIGSEQGGIAALSAGADEFARASEASTAAVEAALDERGP